MGSCCSIGRNKYNSEENPIKESQVVQTPKKKIYNNEGNLLENIPLKVLINPSRNGQNHHSGYFSAT